MLTKSPSSSDIGVPHGTADRELIAFVRSVLESAQRQFGDGVVTEPDVRFNPLFLYTETHYALAAVLLFFLDGRTPAWLDLAAARLRLCGTKTPATFFNAMAVCLARIVLDRAGERHPALDAAIDAFMARTREHRDVAYAQWCGNNAYLQQVTVDMVLMPLARGQQVTADGLAYLAGEFRKYRTPEGFFYDLPRSGGGQEPLSPPTYIMKMLFLAGVCHELHPTGEFRDFVQRGMDSALPLLTREGMFSYFGRTDNSPFAAGLTIFNLRKAAQVSASRRAEYEAAALAAGRHYCSFPRTPAGLLQANRFAGAGSSNELAYSKDDYAFVGQYSLASCAYALLGCLWFPIDDSGATTSAREPSRDAAVAQSQDLGLVKLSNGDQELIARTGSQITSWDRRYLGPTILRYTNRDRLLVGAISRTLSSDLALQTGGTRGRTAAALRLLRYRAGHGHEQLDATSVGYVPVVRRGSSDYLPYTLVAIEISPSHVRARYAMSRLRARGLRPLAIEGWELLHRTVPRLKPLRFVQPPVGPAAGFELTRDIRLHTSGFEIEDRISGPLRGARVLFSTRYVPGAAVHVDGLDPERTATGWGSDGRQTVDVYAARCRTNDVTYRCRVEAG